jgi:BirA family transcriptional regulator, biotin operon repressor / biotin---[acetyl-CoA-carboxylase] ligase
MTKQMKEFSIPGYKELLKTTITGRSIIYLKETDSTNNYALGLIKDSGKMKEGLNGTVILAEIQNRGRGRRERMWISPPGGLWFTIIIETKLEEKKLPEITLIAAYSVASILNRKYSVGVNIKWPNDIYCCKSKLGGILTEVEKIKEKVFLIIGIGINVNNDIKSISLKDTDATSTMIILGKEIERENLLSEILLEFENNYRYYSDTEDFDTIFKKIKNILDYNL